jgi:hypothetical protein
MKVSRLDFAKMVGMSGNLLSAHIRKGYVSTDQDGNIDTEVDTNQRFYLKWSERNKAKIQEAQPPAAQSQEKPKKKMGRPPKPKDPNAPVKQKRKPVTSPITTDNVEGMAAKMSLFELDQKKSEADLEKKLAEIRILKLKEQKMAGEVIPVDLVQGLISQIFQGFVTGFKDGMEDFIIQTAQAARVSTAEQANLRAKMVQQINFSVEKTATIAKKSMKAIAEEYALKRGVGEHE